MISFSPEDRDQFLRWLDQGVELAQGLKGEKARHQDAVWSLLVEAVDTIDRQPDQEKSWLTAGFRSGGWNMIGLSQAELKEIERIRVMSGISPFEGSTRYTPQSRDIDRAVGVLSWLRWCNEARLPERLKKATVALARRGDSEAVRRIYSPTRRSNNRQVAYEVRTRAVGYILNGLKRDVGIIPGDDLSFTVAA